MAKVESGLAGSVSQVERVVLNALETAALPPGVFCAQQSIEKAGLRQFHRLEDKTIHLGLRLTLAGYLGICPFPRSK
jgi:hypothetical protein